MTTTPKPAAPGQSKTKKHDLLPDLTIEMMPLKALVRSKHAVRRLSNRQKKKCKASYQRYGICRAVLITADGEVIDGHAMVEAARELGLIEIPCICISHLSDDEIRGLRIALNKIQETGEWDEETLKLELAYQLEFNVDLTDLGFEPTELDHLFEILPCADQQPDPLDQLSGLPAPKTPAITQSGDVWNLGAHVVACGNMRDQYLLAELFDAVLADLVFSDPPFNTKVKGHIRVGNSPFEEFAEASGEMAPAEFIQFLTVFLNNSKAVLKLGGLLYSFMDWRHEWELHEAVRASGLHLLNKCVWVKPNGGMGSFYRSRYETVFVLKNPGAAHCNNVQLGSNGRYRTNVWEYAGATGGEVDAADDFDLHPTVKPVRLVEDALLDASAVGETVLDPFLGSGTTLLAAERTKRRCVGIEISEAYVDVAIRRWEEMTGRDAILQSTGESFSACSERRRSIVSLTDPEVSSSPGKNNLGEGF